MLSTTKPSDHPIHTRYPQGMEGQDFLQSLIERHLGESICFTECQTDTMDAESYSFWIEIKTRPQYHYSLPKIKKEGWIIPVCKILRAREEPKQVRFYYFWKNDMSLWYYDYCEKDMESAVIKIPENHPDNQPHVYLKQHLWKEVEMCLIE